MKLADLIYVIICVLAVMTIIAYLLVDQALNG